MLPWGLLADCSTDFLVPQFGGGDFIGGECMDVNFCREIDARMSQPLAHDWRRHASGNELASVRVAQRVEPHALEAALPGKLADRRADSVGLQIIALRVREDKVQVRAVVVTRCTRSAASLGAWDIICINPPLRRSETF